VCIATAVSVREAVASADSLRHPGHPQATARPLVSAHRRAASGALLCFAVVVRVRGRRLLCVRMPRSGACLLGCAAPARWRPTCQAGTVMACSLPPGTRLVIGEAHSFAAGNARVMRRPSTQLRACTCRRRRPGSQPPGQQDMAAMQAAVPAAAGLAAMLGAGAPPGMLQHQPPPPTADGAGDGAEQAHAFAQHLFDDGEQQGGSYNASSDPMGMAGLHQQQQHEGGGGTGRKHAPDRRPLRFWQPFNDWWRAELGRLGRRPTSEEIGEWCVHAARRLRGACTHARERAARQCWADTTPFHPTPTNTRTPTGTTRRLTARGARPSPRCRRRACTPSACAACRSCATTSATTAPRRRCGRGGAWAGTCQWVAG
jgi:hypothetical protein